MKGAGLKMSGAAVTELHTDWLHLLGRAYTEM